MYWLGVVLSVVGWLWLVVNAFRTSTMWGIGSLLISPISLIFGLLNFAENKIPLLLSVVGIVLYFMGIGNDVAQMQDAAMLPQ